MRRRHLKLIHSHAGGTSTAEETDVSPCPLGGPCSRDACVYDLGFDLPALDWQRKQIVVCRGPDEELVLVKHLPEQLTLSGILGHALGVGDCRHCGSNHVDSSVFFHKLDSDLLNFGFRSGDFICCSGHGSLSLRRRAPSGALISAMPIVFRPGGLQREVPDSFKQPISHLPKLALVL